MKCRKTPTNLLKHLWRWQQSFCGLLSNSTDYSHQIKLIFYLQRNPEDKRRLVSCYPRCLCWQFWSFDFDEKLKLWGNLSDARSALWCILLVSYLFFTPASCAYSWKYASDLSCSIPSFAPARSSAASVTWPASCSWLVSEATEL